ncbi:hypothetical protein DYB26_005991 [Aphanomyces astaci]|uniref:Carboxypeptidase n=1 Tax=Aphanomyces astaci TaxID=112090 RepID=A0A418FUG1_APHAT|nr:hypothetical protein DYB26_005991 [Aphanomyces astaci]
MVAATGVLLAVVAASSPHKITSLPGYNDAKPINFDQYAGHIPLPSNGQKMFYWLVESESNPSTDPLVLWLNGGPGCSSLSGFFTELGPFVVQSDLSVKRNPYAWNRKANMVFLDSPAGVGFSQPLLNASEYHDDVTAARSREFLKQFLELYPQYKNRDFYITGESYAGMYIPFLVHKLVTDPVENLHLTGFAIGNPYTDQKTDGNSIIVCLSSLDKYPTILNAGLKGLIYSGDADAIVNFIGTQRWLTDDGLNLTVTEKWQAWFGPDKQLAGYTERYTNLTFTTIKGAGHMVPAARPLHALYMFECFLYSNRECNEVFDYPKDPAEYLSGADLTAPTTNGQDDDAGAVVWWWLGIAAAVAVGVAVVVMVVLKKTQRDKKVQYVELNSGTAKPAYS